MCEFCENILQDGSVNGDISDKYGMAIIRENDSHKIIMEIYDGYEVCCATSKRSINHCPICGRKLVE